MFQNNFLIFLSFRCLFLVEEMFENRKVLECYFGNIFVVGTAMFSVINTFFFFFFVK